MGKYIFLFLMGMFMAISGRTVAQPIPPIVQSLNWEQANLKATQEKKLVLVLAGAVDVKIEKEIQRHRELVNYLLRNVIAIRIDMNTPQGKDFESRLLLYPHPAFAFFMPYGDLVGVVSAGEVAGKSDILRETLQKAQEIAAEKKKNSRHITFEDLSEQQALTKAAEENKQVFIHFYSKQDQTSLLMDRNVFNLDRVADFYNRNFVSLRIDMDQSMDLVQKYQVKRAPYFLFLNAKGKKLAEVTGFCSAEQLIQQGQMGLEKAKGIAFKNLTDQEAMEKAGQKDKLIFIDYYTLGTSHKEMIRNVFSDPEVTTLFSRYFVNVGREAEQAALVFKDVAGNELHRVMTVVDADDLLNEAQKVLEGKGLTGFKEEYQRGNRQSDFMEAYIVMLSRAGYKDEASWITMEYLTPFTAKCLKEPKYWDYFIQYGISATPEFFEYVLTHRSELYQLYGEEVVQKKIAALWIAGAENFVVEGKFDEAGFKEYTKRLKKEKVEGWRLIVRNARMHAAEKVGDWKTFIVLAEEKWNEEKISDSELYSWGVKINEQCHDESIRYKTAQWLAQKAIEIDRRERLTGKVKMSSYKGFFEKLTDDLLRNN